MNYNGVAFEEMSPPRSPRFNMNPAEQSRLDANYWFSWPDCVGDLVTAPLAQKAVLGFAAIGTTWDGQAVKYISRSPSAKNPGASGLLPMPHFDFPNGFYLADSFEVESDLPQGLGPNGTAVADEARVKVGFKSPQNGYRTLTDDQVAGVPVLPPFVLPPRPFDGFGLRCWEVTENATSKAQTIPAANGLYWANSGNPPRAVSTPAYVTLWESDISIDWFPVPISAYNEPAMLALVGKTNAKNWPSDPPAGAPSPFMIQKGKGTLVMGTPVKKIIRMGDTNFCYLIKLRLKWYPYGANFFFWHDPPAAVGPPGYYKVQRPNGDSLFAEAYYDTGFLPP